MFLCVTIKALEPLNEVLLLVIGEPLDDVDHENAISTVAKTCAEVQTLILRVVHNLRLRTSID